MSPMIEVEHSYNGVSIGFLQGSPVHRGWLHLFENVQGSGDLES